MLKYQMQKNYLILLPFLCFSLLSVQGFAQETQAASETGSAAFSHEGNIRTFEAFIGYDFTLAEGDPSNLNGWNFSFAGNIREPIGLVLDISGVYGSITDDLSSGGPIKNSLQRYMFLVGPQFSFPEITRVTPFAHALFGAALDLTQVDVSGIRQGSASAGAFAMAMGGGMDFRINSFVNLRLFQTDYVLTTFGGGAQSNFRVSTGVVFLFGNPMQWGNP